MSEKACVEERRETEKDPAAAPRRTQKARNLELLRAGGFNVPDFIYVPAEDFRNENFDTLKAFLERHRESYKVLARSAHPHE